MGRTLRFPLLGERGRVRAKQIMSGQLDASHPQPHTVFFKQFQSFLGIVHRHNPALIIHQLRNERRLAAGRGAQIQNRLAGLCPEFVRGEQRARVLNVKPALPETFQLRQRRMRFQFKDQIFKIGRDALRRVLVPQCGIGPTKEIAPDEVVFHVFRHAISRAVCLRRSSSG